MADKNNPLRIGVLLAAGRGRRMGRTKQLVTWRSGTTAKPLVVAAYDAIRPICDEFVVVLGHEAGSVAAALSAQSFHRVDADPDAEMFESIRAGVTAALAIDHEATVVLHPGDHPEVAPATLEVLIAESIRHMGVAIMPEYHGRGGHPVLIPSIVAKLLVQTKCPGGLREFWETHPELRRRVPVDDPGVVLDIDTAEQLRR